MKNARKLPRKRPPLSFRPLLWGLDWDRLSIIRDKHDIILNIVNEGSLDQWRWIIDTYGKEAIRRILEKRLATEFHPESRHLARVLFNVKRYRNAR